MILVMLAFAALAGPERDAERFSRDGDLPALRALHAEQALDLAACCLPAALAARQGDVVTWILGQGVDPNARIAIEGEEGTRPVLIGAIATRQPAIIHAALDAGADPRVVHDRLGALGWAVNTLDRAEQTVLSHMVAAGADPDDAHDAGISAMDLACFNRNPELMLQLAVLGGDLGSSVCQSSLRTKEVRRVMRAARGR